MEYGIDSSAQKHPLLRGLLGILAFVFGVWIFSKMTPDQDAGKSISPQRTPTEESGGRQIHPPVVPQRAPATVTDNQTNRSKDDTPRWKKIAEWSIAVATVGLLIVNFFQLRATKKAAHAAKSAAETAENSFKLAKRHTEDTDEAIIRVQPSMEHFKEGEVVIPFSNDGIATARDFHAHIEISQDDIRENKRVTLLKVEDAKQSEIRKGAFTYRTYVTNVDWPPIYRGWQVIKVSGTMGYDNGFERRMESVPFCQIIYVQPATPTRALPGLNAVVPAQPARAISQPCDYLPNLLQTLHPQQK